MGFIKSIKENRIGIIIMLISSLFVCFGQLFWKLSLDKGILYLLLGFLFYGIGAILMIVAYKFGRLSVLQPMISSGYIISIIVGAIFLKESITVFKIIGVMVIILGIVVIGGSDE